MCVFLILGVDDYFPSPSGTGRSGANSDGSLHVDRSPSRRLSAALSPSPLRRRLSGVWGAVAAVSPFGGNRARGSSSAGGSAAGSAAESAGESAGAEEGEGASSGGGSGGAASQLRTALARALAEVDALRGAVKSAVAVADAERGLREELQKRCEAVQRA